jgi:hypothetical protein
MVDWGALFEFEHSHAFAGLPTAAVRVNYGIMALDLMRTGRRAAYLPEQVYVDQAEPVSLYPVHAAPQFDRHLSAVYRAENENLELIEKLLAVISA